MDNAGSSADQPTSFKSAAELFVALLALAACSPAPPAMQKLRIDLWTFSLPADWSQEPEGRALLPPDGSKACYAKTLELTGEEEMSEAEFAALVQESFRKALARESDAEWRIMTEKSWTGGEAFHSLLGSWDQEGSFCMMSKVLVHQEQAVQLTLHDYSCPDYPAAARFFAPIFESLKADSDKF